MKKRKDSFWGLHFDFHANPKDLGQGESLCEEDIREICTLLKPDFIQIDSKGHPGWTSFPSKLGNAVPDFKKDTLALWRKVTAEQGVALYMHYSGVYDRKYAVENPEDAIMTPDGSRHLEATRPNGKYIDKLLIPQLIEMAEYGVDGVWVDGDCWMAMSDFSPETIKAFEKELGIDLGGRLPTDPNGEYYHEFREYNRELFRRYVRRYTDAIHEKHPDFQVCSNWAFSDHMPEKVCANVDFLSGDLNPNDSFNSARYAGRALAQQRGYAWDLMSWNFRRSLWGKLAYVTKHPRQIMQEASAVISLGGAYQDYIPQFRDGSPKMSDLRALKDVSEFILARKPYCFRGTPIHQSALLLSTYDRAREAKGLYSRTGYEKVMGATALLCDIGQSLEIVCEHTLEHERDEYKMIVVPETYDSLEEKTVKSLLEYAEKGGNLVLIGKNTCALFARSGAPFEARAWAEFKNTAPQSTENGHADIFTQEYKPYFFTMDRASYGTLFSPCEIVASDAESKAIFLENERCDGASISSRMKYGKGTVTALGFDIGSQYLFGTQYMHREIMKSVLDGIYEPIVKIEGAIGRLEIVALDKDGKLMVQLINAGGAHANASCATDDYIPPVLDIELSIMLDKKPSALVLQPEGIPLDFKYENGKATTKIPRIDIHNIIEVQK